MGLPVVNGKSADTAIKGAIGLLGLVILCITAIIVVDNEVPEIMSTLATALVGALAGFLAGTRVVPTDISAEIKTQPVTEDEKEAIAQKARNVSDA